MNRLAPLVAFAVIAIVVFPVEAQNCPPGYTNNGLACGRGAHTISWPSQVADCPAGYTNTGASCLRPASTLSNGGSRLADCPPGFHNMGASCYRYWPPKSLSMSHMTCNANEFRSGGRCYKPCPEGYTNTGVSCYRGPHTVGMGSMTCPAQMFRTGARCYRPCPWLEYTNTGETCYRGPSTLPRNASINWITPPKIEEQHFYNIAHMANTPNAARWAVEQGANGVEMDLNFDGNGNPTRFQHGGICDCTCLVRGSDTAHICQNGLDHSCNASTEADVQLSVVANLPRIALVYIDSKVDRNTNRQAGARLIQLLERVVFNSPYQGIVIVAAPSLDDLPYLQSAATEAAKGAHADRIFFGLDEVRATARTVIAALQTLSDAPNLVYSTGITSCLADTFYSEISGGVKEQLNGDTRLTSIWTIDRESSMLNYLHLGVRGIVTNRPGVLMRVANLREPPLTLAAPSYRPPRITP